MVWAGAEEQEQASVDASVLLLEEFGPLLARPHNDTIKGSRFANMKELRVQNQGRPAPSALRV